ncbi:MAG: hypothetical protein SPJ78_05765 [Corynebacterium camporealensis]|uniref:hypothetical protein n=1 Tax=Corynebacterium camporealensis TaxID=161896 RepID=UPI002A9142C4|nr:hypothetical protein [Corynebacterium camporealensis]MDY5840207.1 hypothetical protein [Corynebacterium camporealensis]
MHQKSVPLTSVIGIVVALVSLQALRSTTDWSTIALVAAAIAIAFVVTAVIVFFAGALGLSEEPSAEDEQRS